MYNIIPGLFGRDNIIFSARDTDSIIYKIKNCSHKRYLDILENNKKYFNKELGLMENEIDKNINEVISLMSKCYSIQTVNDKKVLFNGNNNKAKFYRISLKNGKLTTQLQLKDDINNFNDKSYMESNLISKSHEINLL